MKLSGGTNSKVQQKRPRPWPQPVQNQQPKQGPTQAVPQQQEAKPQEQAPKTTQPVAPPAVAAPTVAKPTQTAAPQASKSPQAPAQQAAAGRYKLPKSCQESTELSVLSGIVHK